MYKVLKSNFFWLFYGTSLTLFSFSLFSLWGLMVGTLFAIFCFFRLTCMENQLLDREQRFYLFAILLYPLAETALQWAQIKGLMSHDFTWTNRLEHFCWAIALTLFFLPLIAGIWKQLNRWQNLFFITGFVCLLGNLNEFLEYLFRIQKPPIDQVVFANFYTDTILDMTMNLLGSLISFILLTQVLSRSKEVA
jgi:hypothetical protein